MSHDFRVEGLVMRASILPKVDFKDIAQLMAQDVDACKDKMHVYKELYYKIFDGHLHAEECDKLICELMDKEIWTLEETNMVAKKLDYDFDKKPYTKEELRAAMHLMYSIIEHPLKESSVSLESTTYGRLADHYLIENGTSRLVHEYFTRAMCY